MKYLLIFVFMLSLMACQNPKVETLEAEKAALVKLWEEEVVKTEDAMNLAREAADDATEAQARTILALEDAELAMAKLQECESGK